MTHKVQALQHYLINWPMAPVARVAMRAYRSQAKRRRLLLYSIWCLLIAILSMTLVLSSNTADCLSSSSPTSGGDRVFVVKQAAVSPTSYKQTKQSFKEFFEKLSVRVKENTPIGTKLADIQPRQDESHMSQQQLQNDKIIYAIVGGADQQSFTLRVDNSLNKVELISEVNFDYESNKTNYHVLIRATSLFLRYEVEVDILIEDENDNKPQLEDFTIVFNNYKNNFPTGPIGRVPAKDLDIDDVLHYRVLSGNNAQLIVVNETNGDIQLSPWLNSNVPLNAVMEIAVSDGINEAVAKLVLTVDLVTEAMLHNSVQLRFDGIGREEFLSKRYEEFLSQMVRILGTSSMYGTRKIVVFDVEEAHLETPLSETSQLQYRPYHGSSILNSTLSINVSFSARADGNDVEAYYSRQYIEERLHLNRAQIAQNLEVQVAPLQDNLCLQEPCQNYQECQATYKFDRAPKSFYTSRNMIFRPIKALQSFACTCPPTFTGMRHKNECNLQINQCFSNPCLNGGICHRHESGFTCECKADFLGPRCEHSFANSTCQSIASLRPMNAMSSALASAAISNLIEPIEQLRASSMCSGKSRCVNQNKFYMAKPAGTQPSTGGFICQDCPYDQWSNDLCQLRARSFEKNSYLTLPSLRHRHQFHISLRFATVQSDALILYNGRYNDKYDFIALELVDSRLKFSFSLGAGVTSVMLTGVPVSNGDWHKVTIDYRDRNVTLLVDDCDPVLDEALASKLVQYPAGPQLTTKRCSNTTYASPISDSQLDQFRTLDLTSPLQLGAMPPTSLTGNDFQPIQQQPAGSFAGCIGDLFVDHQLVDLSSPIQEFGTQAGCPEKRTFCQQHSCNGASCQDSYGAPRCSCGEERLGRSCELYINPEKVRKFSGNSYLTFNPIESRVPQSWQLSLHFRSINPNGILFKISLDPEASVLLELSNGGLKLSHRLHSLNFNKILLDDGEWHFVELTWSNDFVQIQVDYNQNLSVQSNELGSIVNSIMKSVTVGASSTRFDQMMSSLPPPVAPVAPESSAEFTSRNQQQMSTPGPQGVLNEDPFAGIYSASGPMNSSQSFVGCIYNLNISDNVDWWQSPNEERNVERGCPVVDLCESNPCPANSRCIRKGLNQRKCVCNQGFVSLGDSACVPVCELNPCLGEGSKCLPVVAQDQSTQTKNPNSGELLANSLQVAQYTCECEPLRIGKNCEHQLSARCPSNWWGQPVAINQNGQAGNFSMCGPCNCDESKGFDGDCDKLTGQCYCKSSHYQPAGADYCLPCDCYLVGSLSSSCNQTSGQCKCRPGVVGRRCDACASSYAEVTLRGCEVIYDACPKTFSDGIWWDKTLLDRMASQQCPVSTSTGTATRFCHKTDGWQKANMFDCISNTFTDLYNQYQFLEENKFQMSTNLAMKIASNLRLALNETISSPSMQLYGSDMYISLRLIHHLIQHESQQRGLNLTHRQDLMYIRNLAESISYILDPAYAENWPEIAARPPNVGAEHLLRLIDTYGRVLIESQSDTFTQPFEVTTKYLTFGMDTLSTDQLWDLSKWTSGPSQLSGAHFPSSPPYATDPFEPPVDLISSRHPGLTGRKELGGHFNSEGQSIYLDPGRDSSSSAVVIPKYDNYPAPDLSNIHSAASEHQTKAVIPLKALRIKSPQELFFQGARPRTKRDELIIPDFGQTNQQRQKPALVVYSIYKSLGPLLPNYYDNSVQNRLGMLATANSPVIWITVRPANGTDFLNRNIQPKITYTLKMVEPMGKTRPQCAVWDFVNPVQGQRDLGADLAANKSQAANNVYGIKQTGRFTTKGCEIKGIQSNHRLRFKYDYVNCSCDHLGAVTVLMDSAANFDYLSSDETSLKDLTLVISLAISIFLLSATLFLLSCVRGHSIKSNSNSINKNLVFILIIIELLIVYSILSRNSLNQREYQCKLVAIFLHYLSISLFLWLLVNAIHFYRMLTELRDINHGPMKFYHVLGYAVSAFFVSIAVGLRIEQFGNYLFCWLSIHEPIIWSMFGPISLIAVATAILFLLALCRSLPIKEQDSNAVELLKSHMLINIIKTPAIALYWLITVYAVNEALTDSILLFPAVIIFKSVLLFALLCIVDKYIRYNLYASWLRFRGEKVPFVDDPLAAHYSSSVYGLAGQEQVSPLVMAAAMSGAYGAKQQVAAQYYATNGQAMTPGFQGSCADIFRSELLNFSAASTTSRSTATGTNSSSVAYKDYARQHRVRESHREDDFDDDDNDDQDAVDGYGRARGSRGHRRRHKKHRKHHHHRHHHHHHHHHHRSHHHHDDANSNDYGTANDDYGHGRRRHGHHHHHHGRGHYERNSNQQLTNGLVDNSSRNDLASSHSSDADDVSTLPKKSYNKQHQSATAGGATTGTGEPQGEPTIQTGETRTTVAEQQQTVPMELLAPSTSGQQQVEQEAVGDSQEPATSST